MTVTKDPADPAFPHHTERGYFRGCKQSCCVHAHTLAGKRRDLLRLRGTPALTDAAPIRKYLQWVLADNPQVTHAGIARAAGLSTGAVWDLTRHDTTHVRTVTAHAILTCTPVAIGRSYKVTAEPSRNRMHAMMRQGWTGRWLCEQLGFRPGTRAPWFMGARTKQITRAMHDRVAALARHIGSSVGPSAQAAGRGKAEGWVPLAALDDDGYPNLRWCPGHPWHDADERAGTLVDAFLDSQRLGADIGEVTVRYGLSRGGLQHLTERVRRDRPDLRQAARDLDRQMGDPKADVVLVALRFGIVAVDGSRGVPVDHPAAVVFRAERPTRAYRTRTRPSDSVRSAA